MVCKKVFNQKHILMYIKYEKIKEKLIRKINIKIHDNIYIIYV